MSSAVSSSSSQASNAPQIPLTQQPIKVSSESYKAPYYRSTGSGLQFKRDGYNIHPHLLSVEELEAGEVLVEKINTMNYSVEDKFRISIKEHLQKNLHAQQQWLKLAETKFDTDCKLSVNHVSIFSGFGPEYTKNFENYSSLYKQLTRVNPLLPPATPLKSESDLGKLYRNSTCPGDITMQSCSPALQNADSAGSASQASSLDDEPAAQSAIKVHQFVLDQKIGKQAGPLFSTILKSGMQESTTKVIELPLTPGALANLERFFYGLPLLELDRGSEAQELFHFGRAYQIPSLMDQCASAAYPQDVIDCDPGRLSNPESFVQSLTQLAEKTERVIKEAAGERDRSALETFDCASQGQLFLNARDQIIRYKTQLEPHIQRALGLNQAQKK